MKLDINEWKPFVTSRLFPVMENGKANQQMLDDGDDCFYVGAKRDDNGVMIHCMRNESLITKGNCIVFICNGQGSVGFANYMDVDFIGTTDIVAGYNEHLNEFVGVFLATVYSQERPKYSFGRKWKTHLRDTEVKLPAKHNADGSVYFDDTHVFSDYGFVPDWKFMEEYIKSLRHKPLTTKNKSGQAPALKVNEWKEFKVSDIFTVKYGVNLELNTCSECEHDDENSVSFVARTAENNGVSAFVSRIDNVTPQKAGLISVAGGGSVLSTFLQKEPFYSGRDLYTLDAKTPISDEAKLFIITIIGKNKYKYSYGRQANKTLPDLLLKLPVDNNGLPDYQFMEDYIKALPYGDRLEG